MITVVSVKYLKDYVIDVCFSDGTRNKVDFYDFLTNSQHPLIRKYLNKQLFAKVKVEDGSVCWGDNEFDINPRSLYKGDLNYCD